MWYLMHLHLHMIIYLYANHSYLIIECLCFLPFCVKWLFFCVMSKCFLFMRAREAITTLWHWRPIPPYSMQFHFYYVRTFLPSHMEVYPTWHPSWKNMNIFGRLQSDLALVSKFIRHLISTLFRFANDYNFKYLLFLFHLNIITSQLQSPPNLMLFPPHIENVVQVITATIIVRWRSRRLAQLAYIDDEAKEGNEEYSKNE